MVFVLLELELQLFEVDDLVLSQREDEVEVAFILEVDVPEGLELD